MGKRKKREAKRFFSLIVFLVVIGTLVVATYLQDRISGKAVDSKSIVSPGAIQIVKPMPGEIITDDRTLLLAQETEIYWSMSPTKNYVGLTSVQWFISQDGNIFTPLPQEDSNTDMIGTVTNFFDAGKLNLPNGNYYLRVLYNEQGKTGVDTIPITLARIAGAQQGGSNKKCSCKKMNINSAGVSALKPKFPGQMLTNIPGKDQHSLGPVYNVGNVQGNLMFAQHYRFDVSANVDGEAGACNEGQKVKASLLPGNLNMPLHHTGKVNSFSSSGTYGYYSPGTNHYSNYGDDDYSSPNDVKKHLPGKITWTDAPGMLISATKLKKDNGKKISAKFSALVDGSSYQDNNGVRKKGDSCHCTWEMTNSLNAQGQQGGNTLTKLNCMVFSCGDGKVAGNGIEQCDDGNTEENDDCNNLCMYTFCGDKVVQKLSSRKEECDDGNTVSNDGCSSACKTEFCGDGIVQLDPNRIEQCDPPTKQSSQCRTGSFWGVCKDDCMCNYGKPPE